MPPAQAHPAGYRGDEGALPLGSELVEEEGEEKEGGVMGQGGGWGWQADTLPISVHRIGQLLILGVPGGELAPKPTPGSTEANGRI